MDPIICWRRYLAAISAPEPDQDEATQALIGVSSSGCAWVVARRTVSQPARSERFAARLW